MLENPKACQPIWYRKIKTIDRIAYAEKKANMALRAE
jgi:hypothetical protein